MRTVTTWSDLLHPGDAPSFFDRNPLPAFEPDAVGYSGSNAWWLAELCRLIYRHAVEEDATPRAPLRSLFLQKAGLQQRLFFNSPASGTQGFLVESLGLRAFAALVFRGTEQTPKDFMEDLDTIRPPLAGEGVEVHGGFLNALNSVWEHKVAPALDKLTVPVFYTGHSLGAALATLAAPRRPPAAVYTFGSPLVGNTAFAETVSRLPIYRVVDDSDLVTTLPPEALGFRHVGELHRLTPPLVKGFRFDPLALFRPPKPLADHAPINYVERTL